MANIIFLQTKPENIHPKNILERVNNSFLNKFVTNSQIILSKKYLQEFINCSIAKKEDEDESKVTFAHVDDNMVYETTLTTNDANEKDVLYVVEQITCKKEGKVINSYCGNTENELNMAICFVNSSERVRNLSNTIKKQKQSVNNNKNR